MNSASTLKRIESSTPKIFGIEISILNRNVDMHRIKLSTYIQWGANKIRALLNEEKSKTESCSSNLILFIKQKSFSGL